MKCNEDCVNCIYPSCKKDEEEKEKKRKYYQEHSIERRIYSRKYYLKTRERQIEQAKERYRRKKERMANARN